MEGHEWTRIDEALLLAGAVAAVVLPLVHILRLAGIISRSMDRRLSLVLGAVMLLSIVAGRLRK